MHRTTINLDEAVYLRVKAMARRKGSSLARTIEELLRSALGEEEPRNVSVPLHEGNGRCLVWTSPTGNVFTT